MNSTPVVPVDGAGPELDEVPAAVSGWKSASASRSQAAAVAPAVAWANKPDDNENGQTSENGDGEEVVDYNDPPRRSLFVYADQEAIKRDVRANLLRPDPYSVEAMYHESGPWQFIARHWIFENFTLGVIAGNAVWIAVDTDWNKESALINSSAVFQIMEHAFCTYFSIELFVRFMAFMRKRDCLKDAWFVFDSILVTMMILETWVFTIMGEITGDKGTSPLGGAAVLRLFRLLRLSRLLRMLRSLPELMILVKGIRQAMRTVLYVILLLVIILYVFAIAFTQLAMDKEHIRETYFTNVALSMYSLLIYGTFLDDLSQFCDDIRRESEPILILVFLFICLSALTVMNMLIGVLCEVVSAVAATEKEMILTTTVAQRMQGIVERLDTNSNGMISFVEFRQILELPQALRALEEVGVDPAGVVDFAELMFFEDSDINRPRELPFDTFMEMILDLRCSNTATVKDIKYMWKQINPKLSHLSKDIGDLQGRTERMENTMDTVLAEVKKLVKQRDDEVEPSFSSLR